MYDMITEDFVSFETAKLLKEKGFDCECSCYYFFKDKEQFEESLSYWNWNDGYTFRYSAPTLQMAMKWLREEHNLHCDIGYDFILGWYNQITSLKEVVQDRYTEMKTYHPHKADNYSSYKDACEEAIKYCLKNLI